MPCCINRNPLRSDEESLRNKLISEEKLVSESERVAQGGLEKNSVDELPPGFRYKENRSVDPVNPPVTIDFSKDLPEKVFRLSQFGSGIRYIVINVPDDSLYFSWGTILHFTDDNIIASNNFGIQRFAADGKFLETICRNYVDVPRNSVSAGSFPRESFRGAWVNHVYTAGNTVWYKYSDYPGGKITLYRYSLRNAPAVFAAKRQLPEGGNLDTFTKGVAISNGNLEIRSGTPGLASTNILALTDDYYAGMPSNNALAFEKNSLLFTTFNSRGDTLCEFRQNDLLKTPVTSTVIRSFGNDIWHSGGLPSFKGAFNDTIFRIPGPDRLLPAYVLYSGDHRVSVDDWLHVSTSLADKILINGIVESPGYLFISYRYYSPDDPQRPFLHKAIFNKKTRELSRLKMNGEQIKLSPPPPPGSAPLYNAPVGIQNDIDEGIDFWPAYVTADGKIAIQVRPEVLKKFVENGDFKNDSRFAGFVRSLKPGGKQLVIMILE